MTLRVTPWGKDDFKATSEEAESKDWAYWQNRLNRASLVMLAEEGIIIVEASKETDFDYAEDLGYNIIKEKEYKTNKHVFLEPAGRKEIC